MSRKTVVITGSTGMIGAALTGICLEEGAKVFAVMRPSSPNAGRLPEHENLIKVECPLDRMGDLPDIIKGYKEWDGSADQQETFGQASETCNEEERKIFYHLGWANTGRNRNATEEGQNINVGYTVEAVRAAAELSCERFVGAGSQAEYGPKDLATDENGLLEKIGPDTVCEPVEYYGKAKLAAYNAGREEAAGLGIGFSWARIFSTYGPNDKKTTMISEGIEKMLKGEQTEFTEGTQIWDYLYVDDMARAIYLIGMKGKDGIYCIGSGKGRPLREYISIMARSVDPAIEPGIGKKPYGTGKVRNICADISKLTRDTGFEPRVEFEEGIAKTVEFMRKQIWNIPE